MDKGFEDKKDIEKYEELIRNIGMQLERAKIGNYVDLMQNPTRIIILNFLGGISRGFGIAIGFYYTWCNSAIFTSKACYA